MADTDRTTSLDHIDTPELTYYQANREWILARKAHERHSKLAAMNPEELVAFREKERIRHKAYVEQDPEKHRELANERSRRHRQANRERILARRRELAEANREKLREQDRALYQKNREQITERKRAAYQDNSEKELERARIYRENNREKTRYSTWKSDLKAKYGLTPGTLKEMERQQDHRCAICRTPFEFTDKNLDHDHKTGKMRGLLCGCCNRGLGQFGDDIRNMQRAIAYLKKHAPNPDA